MKAKERQPLYKGYKDIVNNFNALNALILKLYYILIFYDLTLIPSRSFITIFIL